MNGRRRKASSRRLRASAPRSIPAAGGGVPAGNAQGGERPAGGRKAESFIAEVTEDLRRDRLLRAWRRYGPYALGLLALLVVGALLIDWAGRSAEEANRGFSSRYAEALASEDAAERMAALARIVQESDGGYRILARLRQAALLVGQGQEAEAAALLAALASDARIDPVYRDMASLVALSLRRDGDAADPAAMAERLAALARPHRPFQALAMESLADLWIAGDDFAKARETLDSILAMDGISPAMRTRVGLLRGTLPREVSPPQEAGKAGE